MTSRVALPIVCIFEFHWDTRAKEFEKSLLPKLANEGYNTVCFEQPQDMTARELIDKLDMSLEQDSALKLQVQQQLAARGVFCEQNFSDISMSKLTQLMQNYVSSKSYFEVADKMKTYSACLIQKEIYKVAEKQRFFIEGIDINSGIFRQLMVADPLERMRNLDQHESERIQSFADNLIKFYQRREGVIFIGGALHHANLMAKLKEQNMQDNVVCYFPRSPNRYEDSIDDSKMYPTLNDCSYSLSNKGDIEKLTDKIVKDVKLKNTHYHPEALALTSHCRILNMLFNANFQPFKRAGHYVDALLHVDQTPRLENIAETLRLSNIFVRYIVFQEQEYLAIPEINTRRVAEMISMFRTKVKRFVSIKTIQK